MTGDNIYFYLFDEYSSIFLGIISVYILQLLDNSEYTSTGQLKIDNILDAFDYTSDSNEYNSN